MISIWLASHKFPTVGACFTKTLLPQMEKYPTQLQYTDIRSPHCKLSDAGDN